MEGAKYIAQQPKRIIKTFRDDFIGNYSRKEAEKKLFEQGYYVLQEERVKEWSGGQACCLLLIFFPLVFLARVPKVKVTYELK